MNSLSGNIFITGGAGTLGRQIIKRATEEEWDCNITIFSTDATKHAKVKRLYPQVRSIIGDIRSFDLLYNAMAGHDIVIHAAAVKHIPVSEFNVVDTYQINVDGSFNVCQAAYLLGVDKVMGISTDKAAHPANAYGATKMLMEKMFQEFARMGSETDYHLVRYGNVLESTGSVIEVWKNQIEAGEAIKITDPHMTRFFMSPNDAVDTILEGFELPSGYIYVPKMKSLSIGELADYTVNVSHNIIDNEYEIIPLRPGEKIHEDIIAVEESSRSMTYENSGYAILPSTHIYDKFYTIEPMNSNNAERLTREELEELLNG